MNENKQQQYWKEELEKKKKQQRATRVSTEEIQQMEVPWNRQNS